MTSWLFVLSGFVFFVGKAIKRRSNVLHNNLYGREKPMMILNSNEASEESESLKNNRYLMGLALKLDLEEHAHGSNKRTKASC